MRWVYGLFVLVEYLGINVLAPLGVRVLGLTYVGWGSTSSLSRIKFYVGGLGTMVDGDWFSGVSMVGRDWFDGVSGMVYAFVYLMWGGF